MRQGMRWVLAGLMSAAVADVSFAAAAGGAAAGAGEGAAVATGGKASGLARLDANADGAVSVEEFLMRRLKRFERSDRNGDGVLDQDELFANAARASGARTDRLMRRLDRDADGRVTSAEYQAGPAAQPEPGKATFNRYRFRRAPSPERRAEMWRLFDRNGDGSIDSQEFEAARAEEAEYKRRRALHLLDRDSDGKITLDEFTADQRARFVRLDLDGDGRITPSDLPPLQRLKWSGR